MFLGNWPSPSELEYLGGTNHGTDATCVAQGFFLQFGYLSVLLFNASLGVFFVLKLKYSWSEKRARFLEAKMQLGILLICLAAAITPIPLDMYHNFTYACWIDAYPYHCNESVATAMNPELEPTCIRGDNASLVRVGLAFLPLILCVVVDSYIMCVIYCFVRQQESLAAQQSLGDADDSSVRNGEEDKEEDDASTNQSEIENSHQVAVSRNTYESCTSTADTAARRRRRKRSALVARESMLYIGGFLISFGPFTLHGLLSVFCPECVNKVFMDASGFLIVFQGVWNFLIFSRDREMTTRFGRWSRAFTWNKLLRCCCTPCRCVRSPFYHPDSYSSSSEPNERMRIPTPLPNWMSLPETTEEGRPQQSRDASLYTFSQFLNNWLSPRASELGVESNRDEENACTNNGQPRRRSWMWNKKAALSKDSEPNEPVHVKSEDPTSHTAMDSASLGGILQPSSGTESRPAGVFAKTSRLQSEMESNGHPGCEADPAGQVTIDKENQEPLNAAARIETEAEEENGPLPTEQPDAGLNAGADSISGGKCATSPPRPPIRAETDMEQENKEFTI